MMQFQGSSEQKTCRKKNDSNKDSLQVKAGVIFKQLFSNVFAKLVEANSLCGFWRRRRRLHLNFDRYFV